MDNVREFKEGEVPRVGDVVALYEGAYGTGIVTQVTEKVVLIDRVHCSVSVVPSDPDRGQLQIGVERVDVPRELVHRLLLCVIGKGGKGDNRAR